MNYISLKKAAEMFNYHPDYLGQLIRTKKINGKKIGRDWFITEKTIKNYLSVNVADNFLSPKNYFFSKLKFKMFFVLTLMIIFTGTVAFSISEPAISQKIPGDFKNEEILQSKEINGIRITVISSDENGGIEISMKQNN